MLTQEELNKGLAAMNYASFDLIEQLKKQIDETHSTARECDIKIGERIDQLIEANEKMAMHFHGRMLDMEKVLFKLEANVVAALARMKPREIRVEMPDGK